MTLNDIIPWNNVATRRRRPTDDLVGDFFRDIERAFEGWGQVLPVTSVAKMQFVPTLSVVEKEKEYLVTAELPGLEEKEVNVEVTEEYLTISGEKENKIEKKSDENGGGRSYSEHTYGSFSRRISLPADVDREGVEAVMKNGVLTMHLPKVVNAKASARKLNIRADK